MMKHITKLLFSLVMVLGLSIAASAQKTKNPKKPPPKEKPPKIEPKPKKKKKGKKKDNLVLTARIQGKIEKIEM